MAGLEKPGEAEESRKSLLRMQEIIFITALAVPAQPSPAHTEFLTHTDERVNTLESFSNTSTFAASLMTPLGMKILCPHPQEAAPSDTSLSIAAEVVRLILALLKNPPTVFSPQRLVCGCKSCLWLKILSVAENLVCGCEFTSPEHELGKEESFQA